MLASAYHHRAIHDVTFRSHERALVSASTKEYVQAIYHRYGACGPGEATGLGEVLTGDPAASQTRAPAAQRPRPAAARPPRRRISHRSHGPVPGAAIRDNEGTAVSVQRRLGRASPL